MSNKSIAIIFVGFFLLLVVVLFVLLLHVKDTHPKSVVGLNENRNLSLSSSSSSLSPSSSTYESLQDLNVTESSNLTTFTTEPINARYSKPFNSSRALQIEPQNDFLKDDFIQPYSCSSCASQKIIDYLCDSKRFVIIAKIEDDGTISNTKKQTFYQVRVERVFREIDGLQVGLDRMLLYTDLSKIDSCNFKLASNQTYLVTGKIINRNAVTSGCDLVLEWNKILPEEQKRYLQFFQQNLCFSLSSTTPKSIVTINDTLIPLVNQTTN